MKHIIAEYRRNEAESQLRHNSCGRMDRWQKVREQRKEVIIKYVLVNGLSDADIRREVLGWKELDDSTLLDIIAFVEGKEMARDAYKGELSAVKSEYKKQQDDPKLKIKIKCGSCDSRINQFVLQRSGKLSERKFCPKCWRAKNEKPITRLQTVNLNTPG